MSASSEVPGAKRKLGFWEQVKSFSRHFWTANLMEMLERLAYFGVRAVVGIYIVQAASLGGLELSQMDRGIIFTIWAIIQTLLPMFTGGFSDRYGYKISLYIAFALNTIGYILMGAAQDLAPVTGLSNLTWFMAGVILLATGTAIFKPPVQGTLAHSVTDENSSVGWGFFYQLVNIGGFLGPVIAGKMRAISWEYVFYVGAGITLLNYLPTIFLLKDFSKEVREKKKAEGIKEKGNFATFVDSMSTLVKDKKFMIFLAIFSGFWLMFMQLFDTFPIFIDQWVDSRSTIQWLHSIGLTFLNADHYGNVPPEYIIDIDAFAIVIFMPLIGYITGKFKPVVMMIVGMLISTAALVFTGVMDIGAWVIFGIFAFAVGEMTCSPKFSEYIGLMAPPEKKALYMGYSNIPFAIGWGLSGVLSGITYSVYSDKFELARRYMIEVLHLDKAMVNNLALTDVMPKMVASIPGVTDTFQATKILWDMYNPWITWVYFGGIGLISTLAMVVYHFWLEADLKKQQREA